ncbi:hypothetical protein DFJ77DRAFT_457344 [Powellomyces hirtus]|nr:hypothetical protein DFJ77DRAFT_457344 [Powellomyces hirtus]
MPAVSESQILTASQPKCIKRFEITIEQTPQLVVNLNSQAESDTYWNAYAKPNFTLNATICVEVKKKVDATKLSWVFEGVEYGRKPLMESDFTDNYLQSQETLTRIGRFIFGKDENSAPTTFLPGQTYTYPISLTIPSDSFPSFRSEYSSVRYGLRGVMRRAPKEGGGWFSRASSSRKPVECETLVIIKKIVQAPAHPPTPRTSFQLGGSLVEVTAPAYIVLSEQEQRPAPSVTLKLQVVSGPATLSSADVMMREMTFTKYPDSATPAFLDFVTTMDLQQFDTSIGERRALLDPPQANFPTGSTEAIYFFEIPQARSYRNWRDDIDTGRLVKCVHWMEVKIKGMENGHKVETMGAVPIAVHGALSVVVPGDYEWGKEYS